MIISSDDDLPPSPYEHPAAQHRKRLTRSRTDAAREKARKLHKFIAEQADCSQEIEDALNRAQDDDPASIQSILRKRRIRRQIAGYKGQEGGLVTPEPNKVANTPYLEGQQDSLIEEDVRRDLGLETSPQWNGDERWLKERRVQFIEELRFPGGPVLGKDVEIRWEFWEEEPLGAVSERALFNVILNSNCTDRADYAKESVLYLLQKKNDVHAFFIPPQLKRLKSKLREARTRKSLNWSPRIPVENVRIYLETLIEALHRRIPLPHSELLSIIITLSFDDVVYAFFIHEILDLLRLLANRVTREELAGIERELRSLDDPYVRNTLLQRLLVDGLEDLRRNLCLHWLQQVCGVEMCPTRTWLDYVHDVLVNSEPMKRHNLTNPSTAHFDIIDLAWGLFEDRKTVASERQKSEEILHKLRTTDGNLVSELRNDAVPAFRVKTSRIMSLIMITLAESRTVDF